MGIGETSASDERNRERNAALDVMWALQTAEIEPKKEKFDLNEADIRIRELIRTSTPEERADIGIRLADWGFRLFDKEVKYISDRIVGSGWKLASGISFGQRTVSFGFRLPDNLAHLGPEAFNGLPIRDYDKDLYPGYVIGVDDDSGEFAMLYEGPLDDRFKTVVAAMVEIARPLETE